MTAPTSATPSVTAIVEGLRAQPAATAWQIKLERAREAQLYLIGDRVEAERQVTRERARVVVHNEHQSATGRMLGIAAITLTPDEIADADLLANRLYTGLEMAALTDNRLFSLPHKPVPGYAEVSTADPTLSGDLTNALSDLRAQLNASARKLEGAHISSAELFATRSETTVATSARVSQPTSETELFVDLVLIASEQGKEAEFHGEIRRRRVSDVGLDAMVGALATFARDSLSAQVPQTHQGSVLMTGRAAAELFCPPFFQLSPLVVHTSAQAAYQKLTRLVPGQHITPEAPRGDGLTLWSDPLRPWGMRSWACDDAGVAATRVAIIKDGVFASPWADARYGAYMGLPITGEFGNLTLGLGSTPLEALRAPEGGPLYEIAAVSFMNPDPASGSFTAEIKLGYRHDASGITPIKGGSVTGNLFEALGDARFSREAYADGNYYGPAGIRFGSLSIAGE